MIRKKFKQYRELVNYAIAGTIATVVNLAIYYICIGTVFDSSIPLQLQQAIIVAWIASTTVAYFIDRKFVFKSNARNRILELLTFYLSRAITLLLDMGSMFLMVYKHGMDNKWAKLITQVLITVGNYTLAKIWVFR